MPHLYSRVLTGTAIVVVLGLFAKLILTPDPEGDFFLKAGRLEHSGATALALKNYELIVARHPNSPYAPRALLRIGDLLAAQGRQSGNKTILRQSVEAYVKLARSYPQDASALPALESAGTIASQDLSDRPLARGIYAQIIRTNGQESEIGATAIVKLARLSIQDGDGERAKALLIEVLRRWKTNVTIGSEAEYFLGLCYETVFRNLDWATRAYDDVIHSYPNSQWVGDAKERLGLIEFHKSQGRKPTRRVMLNIQPLPDNTDAVGDNDNSMWNALRLVLAARGLSGNTTLLQGYSLTPFYAGLDLNNPGAVVNSQADAWSNVASAAGFRFTIEGGGKSEEALRNLQDDLDVAHLPLVYWQDGGQGRWSLAVGYDTERGEVMLQNRGAQFDTLAVPAWSPKWKVQSSFGKNYTVISFFIPSKIPNPKLTPTPAPTPQPGQTPAPLVNGPPSFVWSFAPLKESVPIGRTAEQAAMLLLRSGNTSRLLNANALGFLANTFDAAAHEARLSSPVAQSTVAPDPTATTTTEGSTENSIYDPTPTPAPTQIETAPVSSEQVARAQKLWAFWNAPAANWIAKRHNAAQWCRIAALKTNNPRFNKAADLFDQSADALEYASLEAKSRDVSSLGDNPAILENLARACRKARNAEREAASLLG